MSTERDRTSHAAVWITTVVTAVAVYVLSVGPVAGLAMNGTIPDTRIPLLEVIYSPVFQLARVPLTKPLYESYVRWWIEALNKP